VSVYTDELMDYIRDHVKRYWGMAYRKTIGVSLITFAIVLAVGLTFTLVTQEFATASYVTYIIFWALLLLIAIFVLLSNLYTSQVSSVRLMHEDEHKVYSTRTGWLMIAIVVGVVAFLMLLFFVPPYVEAVTLLFISGGVFLILYVCIRILFKQKYNELAIGTVGFWLMFIFGLLETASVQFNPVTRYYFSVYFSVMSIMVISSFVGLAMLFNSIKESNTEFMTLVKRLEDEDLILELNKSQMGAMIKDSKKAKSKPGKK
jgi:archaellum component FlaF (FlaF/FlaG flagellin family)